MNKKRLVTWLLVAAMVIGIAPVTSADEDSEQSAAPNAANCVIYNYASDSDYAPTFYVWNESAGVTYRLYTSDTLDECIGTAKTTVRTNAAAVTFDRSMVGASATYLYATRTEAGKEESAPLQVFCPDAETPKLVLKPQFADWDVQEGGLISYRTAGYDEYYMSSLQYGSYYYVDVELQNFTKLQCLTIPIRYDPTVFELQRLGTKYVGATRGFYFNDNAVSTGEEGIRLSSFAVTPSGFANNQYLAGGNTNYGIGIYPTLYQWGLTGAQQDTSTSGGSWVQTPYVNTTTGLIKLEFYNENNVVDISQLSYDSRVDYSPATARKILRLYFKCIRPNDTSDTRMIAGTAIDFATIDDVPANVKDQSIAQRYYCITSPYGYKATVQALDLLAPSLTVKTVENNADAFSVGALTAEQIYALPKSLSAADQLRSLLENQVKIYNYTNYDGIGMDSAANDVLILTTSGTTGAAKKNDIINVYAADETTLIATSTVDNEGGVYINLGNDNLSKDGGFVYVSIDRNGTSVRVPVTYAAESQRDVYFKVYSSGYHGDDGAALYHGRTLYALAGDQIRIDVYFDHFEDLISYTFNLSFDPKVVKAAEPDFHLLFKEGYISEQDVLRGNSCIEIGSAMSRITANEDLLYQQYEKYKSKAITESEALDAAIALTGLQGLTLEELKDIHDAVEVKLRVYGDTDWNGGLLFTGDVREEGTNSVDDPGRTDSSLYPYVDNYNGVLRFMSAALRDPPLELNSSGEGYHFLSLYFVATTNGDPNFAINGTNLNSRNATGTEIITIESSLNGTEMVIGGPGTAQTTSSADTVSKMPFSAHWNLYPSEKVPKTAQIRLYDGNSKDVEDPAAVYLYNGYPYRDPGFLLRSDIDAVLFNTENPESTELDTTTVKLFRYYADSGGIADGDKDWWKTAARLPDWEDTEQCTVFTIPSGKFSATYKIAYIYFNDEGQPEIPKDGPTVRTVYVINKKGDINGDGKVNVFDEQYLQYLTQHPAEKAEMEADTLFMNKTYVEQSELHSILMTGVTPPDDYTILVKPVVTAMGKGCSGDGNFHMYLEFYPSGTDPSNTSKKLKVDELPCGRDVIAVIRYENLSKLASAASAGTGGLQSLGLSFFYDTAHYQLNGFATPAAPGRAAQWDTEAKTLNAKWVTWSPKNYAAQGVNVNADTILSVDAYDRPYTTDTREIYIQYLSLINGIPTFRDENGVLAAFSFHVTSKTFEDVNFEWVDYDIAAVDSTNAANPVVTSMSQRTLLNTQTPFKKPETVTTAGVEPVEEEGVTVTGQINSYVPQRAAAVALYPYVNDKVPDYCDENRELLDTSYMTTVGGPSEAASSARISQTFTIDGVPDGTYLLAVVKPGHTHYVIKGIEISGTPVDLTKSDNTQVKLMTLVAGDVDGNGTVESLDANTVYLAGNWLDTNPKDPLCDIDGNGTVESLDTNIIYLGENWLQEDQIITLK